ncbi:DUF4190 domain-containing protein [Paenibacillus sp. KS-LC4]|uniref:DUF4190 domain-containing protein n=1 Tax=Paenibacillus sp. KS-LC4 TaxID=2979727 RepID=UPI0030D0EDE9
MNNYHQAPFQPPYQPPVKKTNGASIAALVCGIVAFIPFFGGLVAIAAVILGIISLKQISYTKDQGKGMAIAGLICGSVSILLNLMLLFLILIGYLSYQEGYSNYEMQNYYNASI